MVAAAAPLAACQTVCPREQRQVAEHLREHQVVFDEEDDRQLQVEGAPDGL